MEVVEMVAIAEPRDVMEGPFDRLQLALLPTERLEAEATTLAAHIAAATCRFIDLIAELMAREAWKTWECRSMAHWVSWKCGLGSRAAYEHVRVASALEGLPLVHAEFAAGRLSYSKVRSLTRYVTPGDPRLEREAIELAREATARQLERISGVYQAGVRDATARVAREAMDASYVSTFANGDGTTTITARVPQALAASFLAAIDHHLESVPRDSVVAGPARRVHAFAALVDAAMDPSGHAPVEVVALVDVETLSEDGPGVCAIEGRPVATETMRRLACDCRVRLSLEHHEESRDLGRSARVPNRALRRRLERRADGACQFPACDQRHRLRAHHIVHWARGGPTDEANLMLLCPAHHWAVHEGGWAVVPGEDGRWTFTRPDGRVARTSEPLPAGDARTLIGENRVAGAQIDPTTIRSLSEGGSMDLNLAMTAIYQRFPVPVPVPVRPPGDGTRN